MENNYKIYEDTNIVMDTYQITYEYAYKCSNCGHIETVNIPKGIPVSAYLYEKDCPNCGCKNLE